MEDTIITVLLVVLVINIFNIAMILRITRWLDVYQAFSSSKAIELSDPFFSLYLAGPMVSWANLKRTKDHKYWLDTNGWMVTRIMFLFVMGLLLFVNIYLLLTFIFA